MDVWFQVERKLWSNSELLINQFIQFNVQIWIDFFVLYSFWQLDESEREIVFILDSNFIN